MPYRRLPNTDQARLRALQTALDAVGHDTPADVMISYKTQVNARGFLPVFERTLAEYKSSFKKQVAENERYRNVLKKARLYVSHFIQVLNFAIARGEIKKEQKRFYQLKEDSVSLPDLSTEAMLQKWGKNIIEGEQQRKQNGGTPIYNPSIGNVQVAFDIFEQQYNANKMNKTNVSRCMEKMTPIRRQADEIILDIWDQVEAKFLHLNWKERMERAARYGVIYYYRRGEEQVETQAITLE